MVALDQGGGNGGVGKQPNSTYILKILLKELAFRCIWGDEGKKESRFGAWNGKTVGRADIALGSRQVYQELSLKLKAC